MFKFFNSKSNKAQQQAEDSNIENLRKRFMEWADEQEQNTVVPERNKEVIDLSDLTDEEIESLNLNYEDTLRDIDMDFSSEGFNFNTYQEENLHDDLQILDYYIEYDRNNQAKYLMFNIRVREEGETEWTEMWKAVKLLRLKALPRRFREEETLLTTWDDVLIGLHDEDVNFITLIANILKPERIGLVFCYGVQAVAEYKEDAQQKADVAYSALAQSLMGNFPQIEYRLLTRMEASWIDKQMREMKHLLMLRGIPRPRRSAGKSATSAMGGTTANPQSEEQNEEFLRGMSETEYLLLLLTSPVGFSDLQHWLEITSRELGKLKSEMAGTRGISAGVSIPIVFMGNLGSAMGSNFGETNTFGHAVGLSETESLGKSVSTGTSETISSSHAEGVSQSQSVSQGQSHTLGFSESSSLSYSEGLSYTEGASRTEGVSSSEGISSTVGNSYTQSLGESLSASQSLGTSLTDSVGISQGISASTGTSVSQGLSSSIGISDSIGYSSSQSAGVSSGTSGSVSSGISEGISASTGTSSSVGSSLSSGISTGSSYNQSTGTSSTIGTSVTEGFSQSVGTSQSIGNSHSIGHSSSQGTSQSHGTSDSIGTSQSWGTSQSQSANWSEGISFSEGTSQSSGGSYSEGQSFSESTSSSWSSSWSEGFSKSDGVSKGYSSNWGGSINFGISEGVNIGYSEGSSGSGGVNMGTNNGESQSFNVSIRPLGVGIGTSGTVSAGESQGLSASYSENVGMSVGASSGLSAGYGGSIGQGESIGASQSFGHTLGQSFGSGGGTSVGSGTSISEGISWSNGTSISQGTSSSVGGGFSTGISESQGISQSSGVSQSWGQSLSQGVSESFGTTTSSGTSMSAGTSTSYGTSISNGVSNSYGTGISYGESVSEGYSASQGVSNSTGTSFGTSYSEGIGFSNGYSSGVSNGVSSSTGTSQSLGSSLSYGVSDSVGVSYGTSASQSAGVSEGVSIGSGISKSDSYGTSVSDGISQSVGVTSSIGTSVSDGESVSKGISSGVGKSVSDGVSVGMSEGVSKSTTDSIGISEGVSKSEGVTQSTSNGTTTSETQSLAMAAGKSTTQSLGSSSSMALGPSIGYSKSSQWYDENKANIVEILDEQRNRLMSAIKQGAFYVDIYILTSDEESKKAASVLAKGAFYGDVFPSPVQIVEPDPVWAEHLMMHASVFSACTAVEDSVDLMEGYKFSTILLPEEISAYSHPPRFEGGDMSTIFEAIPYFHLPGKMEGNAFLGHCVSTETGLVTKIEYMLSKKVLMHTLIVGSSGSGKTVTSLRFISELVNNMGLGATILDWKDDWRSLMYVIPEEKFHFYSLGTTPVNRLNFNALAIPKGVDVDLWIDSVVESFVLGFGLGQRGYEIMWRNLGRLYSKSGAWKDTEKSQNLTLLDLYNEIDGEIKAKGANKQAGFGDVEAYNRVLSRMGYFTNEDSRLYSMFGNPENAVPVADLCIPGHVVVLEAQGLKGPQKSFLLGLISAGIFQVARVLEPNGKKRYSEYEHMIVFEEAHQVVKGTDTAGGDSGTGVTEESTYEVMWNEARSAGLYMVALAQMPTHLPTSVLANTRIYIAHQLGADEDIDFIARRLLRDPKLDHKDFARFFEKVPLGYAVVQTRRVAKHYDAEPVLTKIAMIEAPRPSDDQLRMHMIKLQGFELT